IEVSQIPNTEYVFENGWDLYMFLHNVVIIT
ncbi:unnamed protein product, partial [marine sediment metagenome]